ncbi:hypothetical protein MYCTH_2089137 [Thermothelomyces thermophilus ATCC 42464]|uniref:Protein kinase domain-containing protein n=1 Tax=Thermothelomyces thermophilus (strain ATCC 42464 / BCRC 31852 / DSM 1799) TaxID=573729 RepID=G2Q4L7_THET4|nr:uncharacterized protein MYCTH_2089137 [Thermothelomyces thermophilus ATCC 42464]AEO54506.1 hypothetical protein MYCTH_2089137 [Thermothelomyces thermophilus ATCC 42464]
MRPILPFSDRPGECLSIGPSQGLVYAIDQEIVLKVPFQYPVLQDDSTHYLLDLALKSFVSLERELAVYDTLRNNPHLNIARRLETDRSDCLFLERLTPLAAAWPGSNELDRRRWALELLDAVSWLEDCGWAHGDLAVRNLGVDSTKRLKVFDFGSAIPRSHPDYANEVWRDHFDLATCLHFILSGIDPFAGTRSCSEVEKVRSTLTAGRGTIRHGADVLADIIQDGWTGRASSTTFRQLSRRASDALSSRDHGRPREQSESHYRCLESRCRAWLDGVSRNPMWRDIGEYVSACKAVEHEVDMDIWR